MIMLNLSTQDVVMIMLNCQRKDVVMIMLNLSTQDVVIKFQVLSFFHLNSRRQFSIQIL